MGGSETLKIFYSGVGGCSGSSGSVTPGTEFYSQSYCYTGAPERLK